ncbi:MAG: phenylalanine--tRNA ligase subunit beta [Actinomycetota bacterium]|nr:phenylalanine--tRNA ligase subunit beta [Actinomycetota bacterium]
MRVGLNWLREFVDIEIEVEELVTRLSMSGTKVETVHAPGQDIEGVVVAEVLAISEHPNADTLTLVDVRTGDGNEQRVVCGARNFGVGDRVPLAQVGARLPGMKVAERKIRGEVSRGMLCSAAELELSKDHSGIYVLGTDAPLGEDIVALLELDDPIIELELTPNRPDCMGMVGVAREVAALTGKDLRLPSAAVTEDDDLPGDVRVEILDAVGCPRYCARFVDGVATAPSPSWLGSRLTAAGIRPVSNVVDITNYVMLETAQPLHGFDASKVNDHHILVRRAEANEALTTLDGVERTLAEDDLLIADPARPLGIAGVMGGIDSEVSPGTTSVIVESAYFDKASIAFTSRRHQLRSEASARFERGTDPENVVYAATRAVKLIAEHCGGAISSAVADAYPAPQPRASIRLRPARAESLLGARVPKSDQAAALKAIGLVVEDKGGALEVEVPGFRPDLGREVDLIEEVARLAGFEGLPSTLPKGWAGGLERSQRAERALKRCLVGVGLSEAWTPSFMSDRDLDALGVEDDNPARRAVELMNPMTEDERWLRTTLIPGLMRSSSRNLAHGAPGLSLFEIARVYEPNAEPLPEERLVLSAVFAGQRTPKTWPAPGRTWDLFGAKGILQAVFLHLGLQPPIFDPGKGMPFHPTRVARVRLDDTPVGVLGEIHPDVIEAFEFPVGAGAIAFELALEPLFAVLPGRPKVEELPRFPPVYADLAVVVDEEVPASLVESIVRRAGGPDVQSVHLFDVYRGEQVRAGKKSLAYALEMRAPDRTMTDVDASAVLSRIVNVLGEKTGAELRS